VAPKRWKTLADPVLFILHAIDAHLINLRDNSERKDIGVENGQEFLIQLKHHLDVIVRNSDFYIKEL
jgi:hypothetical protein